MLNRAYSKSFRNLSGYFIELRKLSKEIGLWRAFRQYLNVFQNLRKDWGLRHTLKQMDLNFIPANPFLRHRVKKLLLSNPKLHLGCGNLPHPGWVNQDIRKYQGVQLVLDAVKLRKYVVPDSLDEIFTAHMLEHLSRFEVKDLLKEFSKWLRPGGELWIAVPDLKILYPIAIDPACSKEVREIAMLTIANSWPGHASVWFFEDLAQLLEEFGFCNIAIWNQPPDGFDEIGGGWSATVDNRPISLNVCARRGNKQVEPDHG